MISMTVDTEWCPDPVIEDTVALLDRYGVEATLFSTHDDGVDAPSHERALHPNFLDADSEEAVLAEVAADFPDAEGLRSHAMYVHSQLRDLYPEYGITFGSNYMQYLVEDIRPFWLLDGVIQFPVYFMDDMWFRSRASTKRLPDIESLLSGEGLKVFDFHPVHVYLNTPTQEYYQNHKDDYQDSAALQEARAEGPGVRDLFVALIKEIERTGRETKTLGDLAAEFRVSNDPDDISI